MHTRHNKPLQYQRYPFTARPGWSISRFETFDKCKRLYFYTYYSKFVPETPAYKINMLKRMTSIPLEIGNVVHDVLEAFLHRLQKSSSDIDEERFFKFSEAKAREYFSRKTFLEVYYKQCAAIDVQEAVRRIHSCLRNFIESPIYNWIFMKAITNKENWMVEPDGFGETRLNGLKAYCKMDFLFPVDGQVHILDWKTGKKNEYKHRLQLIGYAAAAQTNFHIPWNNIFPKIIYLHPTFEELEFPIKQSDLNEFSVRVARESSEMLSLCRDPENNIPFDIEHFPKSPSPGICRSCNFQELCFPEGFALQPESF